jgi:Zn-dependent M28 family amino/carboxypeptidase
VEKLDEAAKYIESRLKETGIPSTKQTYTVEGQTFRNVIATFGPNDGERIIVGAHYDSCGSLPCADDNASGTASLLELARLLSRDKDQPKTRIDVVFYTLEEPPFFRTSDMGSGVHADQLKKDGAKVRAMLCLEMVGYFTDKPNTQEFPVSAAGLVYPKTGNFIAVIGDMGGASLVRRVKSSMTSASDLPVWSMNAPASLPGIDFSDHLSYWAKGFPAVMITDTAFYRNKNYHQPSDKPDTLDYARMAKVVDQVYAAVLDLAK